MTDETPWATEEEAEEIFRAEFADERSLDFPQEQLQLETEAVPKRKAPLRKVERHSFAPGGKLGGIRLYLHLECGHVQERIPRERYGSIERARCAHCIGATPNTNELALAEGAKL